jgi:NAD(P)-dependent dehydrogenase (short-subunit alcohol dehydrogenase family)
LILNGLGTSRPMDVRNLGTKPRVRVNAVAPCVVHMAIHEETPEDIMKSLSPMGRVSTVRDITDAVMYLTDAATVTGETLYVDGGAHFGRL